MVKNTPAMWETWIPSLGWEDPLENGMATHSSILAWRIPWTVRRSNQLILKEINCEYSLEGLMLKLQSFGHPIRRADSLEKTLMLERLRARGEVGNRG